MRKRILMILAVFTVSISGCAGTKDLTTTLEFDTQQKIQEYVQYSESSQPQTDSPSEEVNSEASGTGETTDTAKNTEEGILEYDGTSAYAVVNSNKPFFTKRDYTTEPFETYSELDSLGRCGVAYANICKEIMPTEERGEIGMVKPSGWHTIKYNGIVDGNYLYNRCHLVGYQLAGENANEKNLITGTRYLNVTGMLSFENQVADYIEENPDNHVLYRVTPEFEGSNLVASGVLMEASSVEDKGKGLSFCVYCYNVQPGIQINYETGESSIDESYRETETQEGNKEESGEIQSSKGNKKETYILNTNTKKFHKPDCSSVSGMSESNRKQVKTTRSELIEEGYAPCKNCNP